MISDVYIYASFYVMVCLLISGVYVILCLMIYSNEKWRIIVFCFITPCAAVLKHIFYEASNINRVLLHALIHRNRCKHCFLLVRTADSVTSDPHVAQK